jgi:hypothetical protein
VRFFAYLQYNSLNIYRKKEMFRTETTEKNERHFSLPVYFFSPERLVVFETLKRELLRYEYAIKEL